MNIATTCPYCGVGCGVLAASDGSVRGDPDHPANFGRLCSKGTALGATLGVDRRLLAPQLKGREVSWDHALGMVAERFQAAIQEHGPDSVAFYVSGQLLTEDYYVANKLMKGFIGSANIDTNSRLCMASSVAGHKRAFGADTVPGQYSDFEQADLVVLVGSNTAWCHPVLYRRLEAARAARPEMKVVVVDPRRTTTAQDADLHLAISPDGDAALFNRLLREIAARDLIDHAYVAEHVEGLEAALQAAQAIHPCGLSEGEIAQFLDLWCSTKNVVTLYSQGVNQSSCGSDKVNAILNCHLATGRIGKPGQGPFSMTGQPNAMGGREVGGLANMLACHLDLENADHRDTVQSFWQSPRMADKPGLKAVDLFRACADGRIKALWVMSTNPAVSMPEADQVAAAIRAVPFTVASDIVIDTDTNACCNLLLPALGWGEKSGTVTNSERRISRQRRFLPAPGKARADWDIIAEVGRRMGWRDAFDYASEADVFREYAALSGQAAQFGRDFDISGLAEISDADYDDFAPQVWPVPAQGSGKQGPGAERFFANGGFFHPGGRAKMLAITPPLIEVVDQELLRFNTGRVRDHWHTMTRTGRAPQLASHMAEPYLEVHPLDAARIGLEVASLARVQSLHGEVILRVLITDRVQPGQCFAPMHWSGETASAGRVNALVTGEVDPVSGQPALKGMSVSVTPYAVGWYGFAASVAEMQPKRPYAAVARSKTGWRAEVAGHKIPQDWQYEARQILNLPEGALSLVEDHARGAVRVAIHQAGRLVGVFFAAREPVQVMRSQVVEQLGLEISALNVLAGLAPSDQPAKGAIVCACMDVGREELRRAIAAGADTVPQLVECTGAGSNCGSCRPELAELVAEFNTQKVAAE